MYVINPPELKGVQWDSLGVSEEKSSGPFSVHQGWFEPPLDKDRLKTLRTPRSLLGLTNLAGGTVNMS